MLILSKFRWTYLTVFEELFSTSHIAKDGDWACGLVRYHLQVTLPTLPHKQEHEQGSDTFGIADFARRD
jgi:hypothetical protein